MPRSGIAGPSGNSMFNLFEEAAYCFSQLQHPFTFLPTVHKGPDFSTSLPTLVFCVF